MWFVNTNVLTDFLHNNFDTNLQALSRLQEWQRNEEHAKTRHSSDLHDYNTQLQRLRYVVMPKCFLISRPHSTPSVVERVLYEKHILMF